MDTDLLTTIKVSVFVAWLAVIFVAENLIPAHRWGRSLRRWGRNRLIGAVTAGGGVLCVIPLSLLAVSLAPSWRTEEWSGLLILDILVLDLFLYWWHRVNHEWPILWRLHEVHHLDEQLDSTSAVRFHFGEVILGAIARTPVIFLLDMSFASVLIFETLVVVGVIFHHSNLRLPPWFERGLSWIIVTPMIHWVHHHARQVDTDSNYGTLFSFWDRIFGSRSQNKRFSGMKIGVEGQSADKSLLHLLVRPFRRRR